MNIYYKLFTRYSWVVDTVGFNLGASSATTQWTKVSCAKHSSGGGAPLAPRMPSAQ